MQIFVSAFEDVPDPRASNARYDLGEVLVIAFVSVLCGSSSCAEMAAFGRAKEHVFRDFLRLKHAIPSHDTFCDVFRMIDPKALDAAFGKVLADVAALLKDGDVIAIDGEALRGARDKTESARTRMMVRFFRADAAYAIPAIYARLEEAGYFYAIRLPANAVLKEKIADRLTRPVGRPSLTRIKRFCEDFEYQAASWDKPRRVIAKIEWHPGELFPRVGFIITNLPMEPDWVVRFYNQRGTAEQHIKEGKYAFHWTRLSCKRFRDNPVRLQLHALAYNLATFLRCIELPEAMADWSLTSLQLKLIKMGARVVRHARAVTFQLAEVAVTGAMVRAILAAIRRL